MPARTLSAFVSILIIAISIACIPTAAQDRQRLPLIRPLDFRQAIRESGRIFEGVVVSIAPERDAQNRPTAVRVVFKANRSLRGSLSREQITIREWVGLWRLGPRYHVGERALMLVYPMSKAGFTSPVGGELGHIKVSQTGRVVLPSVWRDAKIFNPAQRSRSRIGINEFANAVRRAEQE